VGAVKPETSGCCLDSDDFDDDNLDDDDDDDDDEKDKEDEEDEEDEDGGDGEKVVEILFPPPSPRTMLENRVACMLVEMRKLFTCCTFSEDRAD
jgi:hypothetical protein